MQVGVEQRLAGPHPVLVALHGVDLAVVGDVPVRVGERPRRERVGGEAASARARAPTRAARRAGRGRTSPSWSGDEHALVDEGAGREAREVHAVAVAAPSSCSMRLRTTKHRRSRSMPDSAAARRPRRRTAGGTTARRRRPAGRSSSRRSGTSRQPRTCRPSSAAIFSMPRAAAASASASAGQEADAGGVGAGRRAGRSRRPSRRKRSGTWIRIPAPSPTFASAPVAPRWSRLQSDCEARARRCRGCGAAVHVDDEGRRRRRRARSAGRRGLAWRAASVVHPGSGGSEEQVQSSAVGRRWPAAGSLDCSGHERSQPLRSPTAGGDGDRVHRHGRGLVSEAYAPPELLRRRRRSRPHPADADRYCASGAGGRAARGKARRLLTMAEERAGRPRRRLDPSPATSTTRAVRPARRDRSELDSILATPSATPSTAPSPPTDGPVVWPVDGPSVRWPLHDPTLTWGKTWLVP